MIYSSLYSVYILMSLFTSILLQPLSFILSYLLFILLTVVYYHTRLLLMYDWIDLISKSLSILWPEMYNQIVYYLNQDRRSKHISLAKMHNQTKYLSDSFATQIKIDIANIFPWQRHTIRQSIC